MIDTLKLRLDRPVLRQGHKLTLQARPELAGQPVGEGLLLRTDQGQAIETGKAYFNGLVNIDTRYGEMFLNVSLPKVKAEGKANVWPVSQAEASDCLKKANEYLADEVGVLTDLSQASVSRVDIFSNANSIYSFNDYRELFQVLDFKRQMSKDYGTTFLFYNGQRETCIYDKVQEQTDKGNDVAGLPKNLIRWEYRLKRSQVCKPALRCPKAETLTATRLLNGWQNLIKIYDNSVKDGLRLEGSEKLKAEILSLKDELRFSISKAKNKNRSNTQGFDFWLDWNGAKGIYARAGTWANVEGILKDCDYTGRQTRECIKRLKDYVGLQMAMDFYGCDDLKRELYQKLSANYSLVA